MNRVGPLGGLLLGVILLGCGGSTGSRGQAALEGGTATFAEAPGASPDYIFPIDSSAYFNFTNIDQFQELMYRPLYWFGDRGRVKLNTDLSLAQPPQISDGGKTVTIRLKDYRWSDGEPVTSRDLTFWMNLVRANKQDWGAYFPGGFPDDIVGVSTPDAKTLVLDLTQPYGTPFVTYNQLSLIVPLPQHLWDRTQASQPVGNYDLTPAGATAVYKFLDGQAKSLATYQTNPLWQVVDGPWKLQAYTSDGHLTMVPNPLYSGPVKPHLAAFKEVPFATDLAELDALRGGGVDVGYLPYQAVGERGRLQSHGYRLHPWTTWSITYLPENFANPGAGPIFKQLYFRQALQHLVDQPGMLRSILKGFGTPTLGPVPLQDGGVFASSTEKHNPYPFSVKDARRLLKSHGWTLSPGGVGTCSRPGSGTGQCGTGIPAGARLQFQLEYASGTPIVTQEMETLKSDFIRAGIKLELVARPFATVIADVTGCSPSTPTGCGWQMADWGGGWSFSPDYYPSGEELWATGAASNYGWYSNAKADALIKKTLTSDQVAALRDYENFVARDLPAVWLPSADSSLAEISSRLHGVTPLDPSLQITPENWYLSR